MTRQEIAIGSPVRSREGAELGDVTRLIVDAETNRVAYLAVDKGIFSSERLIEVSHVTRAGPKGVVLGISEAEAKQMPAFVEQEWVQTRGDVGVPGPFGAVIPIQGSGSDWNRPGDDALYPSVAGDSLFMQAPVGRTVAMTDASVSESDVAIDKGTDVVGADGSKLGRVDEVLLDDEDRLTGFLVKAGLVFTHDVRVPMEWVDGITADHVRLSVTKDEAEQRGTA